MMQYFPSVFDLEYRTVEGGQMVLFHKETDKQVRNGEVVTCFRGERWKVSLANSRAPHKPSSTGRVGVSPVDDVVEYFQSLGLTPEDDKWEQPLRIVHPEDVLELQQPAVNRLLEAAADWVRLRNPGLDEDRVYRQAEHLVDDFKELA